MSSSIKELRNATAIGMAAILLAPGTPQARESALIPDRTPGIDLPVTREHRYTMSGRVRMLLLWIGRDDVGSGVIRWRGSEKGSAYELLIGSDPLRAPARLNRWGYLAEEIRGEECAVVGLISKSDEQRLKDVAPGGPADSRFKSLRSRVTEERAYASVSTVQTPTSSTYREADAVLKLALGDASSSIDQIKRPAGVRSGFLSSVAEIITLTVHQATTSQTIGRRQIQYVYGDKVYQLTLLEAATLPRFETDGRIFPNVIRARFETGLPGAGSRSRFELVYGTAGELSGVPIVISYQPKWWLHVDLVIES